MSSASGRDPDHRISPELTAVAFTYNRRWTIETVLRSATVADRLVVFDKGSTDGTAEIGRAYADQFFTIPWSATVEATKAEYIPQIESEWLLVLDDDECLNVPAINYISAAVKNADADVHYLPFRHFVLGRHDERAYYWPEYRPALFRRGALEFTGTVHGGTRRLSENHVYLGAETGAAILHLSHADAASWLEKTNRYTDNPVRTSSVSPDDLTPEGVIALMQGWMDQVPAGESGYLTAVAALRGVYDIVDAVKSWEQQQDVTGPKAFARICDELQHDYDMLGIERRPPSTSRTS